MIGFATLIFSFLFAQISGWETTTVFTVLGSLGMAVGIIMLIVITIICIIQDFDPYFN